MRANRPAVAAVSAVLVASLLLALVSSAAEDEKKKERKQYDKPPEMTIDPNKKYTATIETDRRHDHGRAVSQGRAAARQQLRVPRPRGVLRRRDLPPRDPRAS